MHGWQRSDMPTVSAPVFKRTARCASHMRRAHLVTYDAAAFASPLSHEID